MDGSDVPALAMLEEVRRKRGGSNASRVDVPSRLRHFRVDAKLTQEDLARAAKLTAKFVSQIENGRVNPSIAVIARLVEDGLQLPLAAFFAHEVVGDLRDDLEKCVALVASQTPPTRRRALQVLRALCDEPGPRR